MKKQKEYLAELYVELATRKLSIDFNDETDCIYEVYNSWFKFFGWCREQMKKIAKEEPEILLVICRQVYTSGEEPKSILAFSFYNRAMYIMRSHLENYSYDFRSWWNNGGTWDVEETDPCAYQPKKSSQMRYELYHDIISDIKSINKQYQDMLQEIIKQLNQLNN